LRNVFQVLASDVSIQISTNAVIKEISRYVSPPDHLLRIGNLKSTAKLRYIYVSPQIP